MAAYKYTVTESKLNVTRRNKSSLVAIYFNIVDFIIPSAPLSSTDFYHSRSG